MDCNQAGLLDILAGIGVCCFILLLICAFGLIIWLLVITDGLFRGICIGRPPYEIMGCCISCSVKLLSNLFYCLERVTTCAFCAMMLCCTLLTITLMTIFGISLGYHYSRSELLNLTSALKYSADDFRDALVDDYDFMDSHSSTGRQHQHHHISVTTLDTDRPLRDHHLTHKEAAALTTEDSCADATMAARDTAAAPLPVPVPPLADWWENRNGFLSKLRYPGNIHKKSTTSKEDPLLWRPIKHPFFNAEDAPEDGDDKRQNMILAKKKRSLFRIIEP